MSLAIVIDDLFAEHIPPGAHPERPERVLAVRDALKRDGTLTSATKIATRMAREEELGQIHSPSHILQVEKQTSSGRGWIDEDTYFGPGTWKSSLSAVGAACDLVSQSLSGEHAKGLAIVRPPGHHAEPERAMGFCLFNNVAIGAESAIRSGASRVAIVDWDVHHGNGTQRAFYDRSDVLFLSLHQSPLYPGSGAIEECGVGEGIGRNVNIPLSSGAEDVDYEFAFSSIVEPCLRKFDPDIVLISAGYDAFVADPLAGMNVSIKGFSQMARSVVEVANEVCQGRLVAVLEGGYALEGVGEGMSSLAQAMTADKHRVETHVNLSPSTSTRRIIDAVKTQHPWINE